MASFGSDLRNDFRHETRETPRAPTPPASPQAASSPVNSSQANSSIHKAAVLGPTLRFKGELSAEEDFILQGSLEGSISNPQNVTVGTEGSVIGDIKARIITIDGKIEGDLHGVESVVVHQTGRVSGNIFAPRVGIVEGAFFNGRIEMVASHAQASASQTNASAKNATQSSNHGTRPVPKPSDVTPGIPLTEEQTERVLAAK